MLADPFSTNFDVPPNAAIHGLCIGLSLVEAKALLLGWEDHPIRATGSGNELFVLWDFTPPEWVDASPLRLTFKNDQLIVWGAPADSR